MRREGVRNYERAMGPKANFGSTSSGLDELRSDGFASLRGARVGLIANQASTDRGFSDAAKVLFEEPSVNLVRLFAPEHGFRGELQDMETVSESADPLTGVRTSSLYGLGEGTLSPSTELLEDLDIVVVDLQDVGARYYTFSQTLAYTMKAASKAGIKVIVLDRPNPLGGMAVEGAELLAPMRSFCGYAPIANRHGLTMGELACLFNRGFGEGENAVPPIDCELEVCKLTNWNRADYFDKTGLPWVPPSPNMPTLDSAIVYPGTCLFEGTELSEGRGTTRPFEQIGAPFIDGRFLASESANQGVDLRGAHLRPVWFKPKFQKYADETCSGVFIHVTDRMAFRPIRTALAILFAVSKLYPENFSWRKCKYEFVSETPAIDLLYGNSDLRDCIDGGLSPEPLIRDMEAFETRYERERGDYLLY